MWQDVCNSGVRALVCHLWECSGVYLSKPLWRPDSISCCDSCCLPLCALTIWPVGPISGLFIVTGMNLLFVLLCPNLQTSQGSAWEPKWNLDVPVESKELGNSPQRAWNLLAMQFLSLKWPSGDLELTGSVCTKCTKASKRVKAVFS